jgi:hypothetical protein
MMGLVARVGVIISYAVVVGKPKWKRLPGRSGHR